MFENKTLPHVIQALAAKLRTQVSARGKTCAVIELDGSMNSAVALGLLCQCGIETTAVVFDKDLPFDKDLSDLAVRLGLRFSNAGLVRIEQDVELPIEKELQQGFVELWKLAWLDATARKRNGLVAHPINRDDFRWIFQFNERLMSVDMLPLAGLHYSEVVQLGIFLGIPKLEQISPSGFEYPKLEECSKQLDKYGFSSIEILSHELDTEVVTVEDLEHYCELAIASKHLLTPEPTWCEVDEFRSVK